jgi:hypothetical protein
MNEPKPPSAPKGNVVLILLAILCAFMVGPHIGDRDVEYPHGWWKFHEPYLDGVAAAVAKYKEVHGRYPDNNQGLHDLDTFEARFDALFISRGKDPIPASPDPADDPAINPYTFFCFHVGGAFWRYLREDFKRYRYYNSRYGRNGSDIMFGPFLVIDADQPVESNERRVQIAISQNNCFYLIGPNCVYDPTITPYGYENRNGLDGKLFANSIANSDPRRKFSREVAQGVYVYSYNARNYYETYRSRLVARRVKIYGYGTSALGLLVIAAYRSHRSRQGKGSLVFPALAALLAFVASAGPRATCYKTSSMPRRFPKDLEAQQRLLEQFRDSGVITPETYGKAMKGFETDAVFVPSKDHGPSRE